MKKVKTKVKFKVGGDAIAINLVSIVCYLMVWVMAVMGILNHFLNPEIVPLPETNSSEVISWASGKFPSLWAGDGQAVTLPDVLIETPEEAFEWFVGELNAAINNKGIVIEGTGYNVVVNAMGPMGQYQYQKTTMDKFGSIQNISGIYDETPSSSPAKSYAVNSFAHKTMVDDNIVFKSSFNKPNKVNVNGINILDMDLSKMNTNTYKKTASNQLRQFEFDLDISKFYDLELKTEKLQGILLGYTLSFNLNRTALTAYIEGAKAAIESSGYKMEAFDLNYFTVEIKLYNYGGLKSISYKIDYDLKLGNIPVLGKTTTQNHSDVDMFFSYPKEEIKIELP